MTGKHTQHNTLHDQRTVSISAETFVSTAKAAEHSKSTAAAMKMTFICDSGRDGERDKEGQSAQKKKI